MNILRRLPELQLLLLCTIGCYIFLEFFVPSNVSSVHRSVSGIDLILISFFVSVLIAIIAVIAVVGGGVIFTPLMLAFTTIELADHTLHRFNCCYV